MCSPSLRTRLAANPNAASTTPEAAAPPPRNLGVTLAAFRGPTQSMPPVAAAATRAPLLSPATLVSLNGQASIEARQARPPAGAQSPKPVPPAARGQPALARPGKTARRDILASSRYDGLHGKELDAALEDSYRNQQAIDAQAEWNATLGRITRDYQVPDDPDGMVYTPDQSWPPHLRPVTAKERRLIAQLPIRNGVSGWGQFFAIGHHAVNMTGSFIGLPTPEQVPPKVRDYIERTHPQDVKTWVKLWRNTDGHSDAFRRAYWNALMTKAFGPVFTQAYGTAHEGGPNSPRLSEAMDLYNNEVGRTIAEDHPDASEQQLAVLVRDALRKGKLVVVDQDGRLAWSDRVKWAEHGLTPPTPGSIKGGKIFPTAGDTYHP